MHFKVCVLILKKNNSKLFTLGLFQAFILALFICVSTSISKNLPNNNQQQAIFASSQQQIAANTTAAIRFLISQKQKFEADLMPHHRTATTPNNEKLWQLANTTLASAGVAIIKSGNKSLLFNQLLMMFNNQSNVSTSTELIQKLGTVLHRFNDEIQSIQNQTQIHMKSITSQLQNTIS